MLTHMLLSTCIYAKFNVIVTFYANMYFVNCKRLSIKLHGKIIQDDFLDNIYISDQDHQRRVP